MKIDRIEKLQSDSMVLNLKSICKIHQYLNQLFNRLFNISIYTHTLINTRWELGIKVYDSIEKLFIILNILTLQLIKKIFEIKRSVLCGIASVSAIPSSYANRVNFQT